MTAKLTTEQVWQALERNLFAVVGMVSARGEGRTAGIVYVVHDRKFYFGTDKEAWKARHIAANPNVSLTVPIPKRIPFLPWVKIPAATITFSGTARILTIDETPTEVGRALTHGLKGNPEERLASSCVVEVTPKGDFLTYGVGVSLATMRDTEAARGRAPVG